MSIVSSLGQRIRNAGVRRTRRERLAVLTMIATIALALWAQLLWSAHHERLRLARIVGDLRTQNALMKQARDLARDIGQQGKPLRPLGPDQALATFSERLRAQGLAAMEVSPDGSNQIRLSGSGNFDSWMLWAAAAHAEHGAQILRLRVEPSGQPGVVKLDATIALGDGR